MTSPASATEFQIPRIIEHKRDGGTLSPAEINFLIHGFTAGSIPDYQMSAWAMAVFFQGMDAQETAALTLAIRDSGRSFQWPANTPPKIDKHSTGGVGDKVSLVLAPLLAAAGFWVPMISGRGLGITGGTLDKLESIPGFRVELGEKEALRQLEDIGVILAGQSAEFCPADRRLYALRDVTGTVPSRPLIVASILGKKLAESLDRLILDVKFGSGAFMKTRAEAELLGQALLATGQAAGLSTSMILSPMDEPLGQTVGNALEVQEAIACLQNQGPPDLMNLTYQLAEAVTGQPRTEWEALIANGNAWETFRKLVARQGGDLRYLDDCKAPSAWPAAVWSAPLCAPHSGTLQKFDAGVVGRVVVALGGGRQKQTDLINHSVGLTHIVKAGTPVVLDQPLAWIHAPDESAGRAALAELLHSAIQIQ